MASREKNYEHVPSKILNRKLNAVILLQIFFLLIIAALVLELLGFINLLPI